MTPNEWITVEVPVKNWSKEIERAAGRFPPKNRPTSKMDYITRSALDLARSAYIERASKITGLKIAEAAKTPLILNFEAAKGIGYGVLPILGALLKYRADHHLDTLIELPALDQSRMIDFLQTWQFGQFFEAITGKPFESVLTEESVQKWNSWRIEESYYSITRAYKGEIEALLADSAIYLTPLPHEEAFTLRGNETNDQLRFRAGEIAAQRVAEWTRGRIADLLTRWLDVEQGRSPVEIVCSTILNELLTNSVAHTERQGKTSLVYTYGQFTKTGAERTTRDYFVLSVWDNGEDELLLPRSINSAIEENKAFSAAFGKVDERSFVWVNGVPAYEETPESIARLQETDKSKRTRNTLQDSAHRATIAGVCTTPDAIQVAPTYPLMKLSTDDLDSVYQNSAGLGLYRVKRAAVDLLSGFIDYAGSNIRTEVSRARHADELEFSGVDPFSNVNNNADPNRFVGTGVYRVDIQYGTSDFWPLAGNLWTLWLPVMKDTPRRVTE